MEALIHITVLECSLRELSSAPGPRWSFLMPCGPPSGLHCGDADPKALPGLKVCVCIKIWQLQFKHCAFHCNIVFKDIQCKRVPCACPVLFSSQRWLKLHPTLISSPFLLLSHWDWEWCGVQYSEQFLETLQTCLLFCALQQNKTNLNSKYSPDAGTDCAGLC